MVIYLALSFWFVISWASEVLASNIYQTIGKILELIENTYRMADAARGIAESAHKYIEATEPSHDEAHRTMVAALDALLNTMGVMADAIHGLHPPQLSAPAQEESHSEDDEAPIDP